MVAAASSVLIWFACAEMRSRCKAFFDHVRLANAAGLARDNPVYHVLGLCYIGPMWKLTARGARGTPFTELGSFASIDQAARTIIETEDDPHGGVFFRVYVDPTRTPSDAEVLSRFEYQSAKRFYLLTRSAH